MNHLLVVAGALCLIILLWMVFGVIFTVDTELIAIPATLFVITLLCFYFVKTNQGKTETKFILFLFWVSFLMCLIVSFFCGYIWLLGSNWAN